MCWREAGPIIQRMAALTYLNPGSLWGTRGGDYVSDLALALGHLDGSLHTLALGEFYGWTHEDFQALHTACQRLAPSLVQLQLKSIKLETLEVWSTIVSGISALTQLTRLDLDVLSARSTGTGLLAPALRQLTTLQCLRLHLWYDGGDVAELAGALPSLTQLRCLELLSVGMHGDDMRALALALGGLCQLQTLQLLAYGGGIQTLAGTLAATLAQSLQGMRRLQELTLTGMGLDADALAPLAAALRSLTYLRRLGLPCGRMGSEGAAVLAPVLLQLPLLQHLELDRNALGPQGVISLVCVLPKLRELRHLGLANNNMGPQGAASLAAALPALTVLTELCLADNGLGEGDKASVLHALRGAPLLRHVKL